MALCNGVVLVVEDHPLVRMAVLAVLVEAGFEALEASSAAEAIQVLRLGQIFALCSRTPECPERWMGSNWPTTSEIDGLR
jgi:CheY-like chemotaxis protein